MFTYYESDTAPEESKPLMEQSLKAMKMIPNLHKILAEAPATCEAYNTAFSLFMFFVHEKHNAFTTGTASCIHDSQL